MQFFSFIFSLRCRFECESCRDENLVFLIFSVLKVFVKRSVFEHRKDWLFCHCHWFATLIFAFVSFTLYSDHRYQIWWQNSSHVKSVLDLLFIFKIGIKLVQFSMVRDDKFSSLHVHDMKPSAFLWTATAVFQICSRTPYIFKRYTYILCSWIWSFFGTYECFCVRD